VSNLPPCLKDDPNFPGIKFHSGTPGKQWLGRINHRVLNVILGSNVTRRMFLCCNQKLNH
jgi:hypothetical protein